MSQQVTHFITIVITFKNILLEKAEKPQKRGKKEKLIATQS